MFDTVEQLSMYISNTALPDHAPLVVKPKEARRLLSCSHTRLYELLATRELDSFRDGGARKITVASIHHYIARKLAANSATASVQQPVTPQTRHRGRPRKGRVSEDAAL
jgi:hypothetical protein